MYVRYLEFLVLACIPGFVHAQSATQDCRAPRLNNGYLVPEEDTYNHDSKLTYSCDKGRKPAVEGWWATSTCHNGKWSPEPQCIDEKDCLAPNIPNAKYTENQSGWYEDGHTIRIRCNEGYVPKGRRVTTKCINGNWSSVLICEKSIHACSEPPQVPHAVIILQGFQDFFAPDTKLQYECEDGYTVEGAGNHKYVFCLSGNWTEGPVCSKVTELGAGLGGSAETGTGGTQTPPAGSGTQPEGGAAFCVLDPAIWNNYKLSKVEYIKEGEPKHIPCNWDGYFSLFQCINGELLYYTCCHVRDRERNLCP
ncbi:complement factor H-like isoform X2 [Anoplopoma fimbria]|uniref:complement factor H-like isoform X2 n=1 Tax=Anoplopoma fimbria TaxID=229290 RepID=UPI0023EC9A56|nr:complement factor H-like isoform X2 [Anoplopoma fimbria]